MHTWPFLLAAYLCLTSGFLEASDNPHTPMQKINTGCDWTFDYGSGEWRCSGSDGGSGSADAYDCAGQCNHGCSYDHNDTTGGVIVKCWYSGLGIDGMCDPVSGSHYVYHGHAPIKR